MSQRLKQVQLELNDRHHLQEIIGNLSLWDRYRKLVLKKDFSSARYVCVNANTHGHINRKGTFDLWLEMFEQGSRS